VDEAATVADEAATERQTEGRALLIEDHFVEIEVGMRSRAEHQPQGWVPQFRSSEETRLPLGIPEDGIWVCSIGSPNLLVHQRPNFISLHEVLAVWSLDPPTSWVSGSTRFSFRRRSG